MSTKDSFSLVYDPLFKDQIEEEKYTIDYLLDLVSEYNPSKMALGEIRKAYEFACDQHYGQLRNSGEKYIIHPLTVAIILAQMHADKDTIIAGLHHDLREDTFASPIYLGIKFGQHVDDLVAGLSNCKMVDGQKIKLDNDDYMRQLITKTEKDIEIMIIKLADKLHNMRTLKYKKPERQVETALETLELFSPLAGIFGIYKIKTELEDLSLMYIKPSYYDAIVEVLKEELFIRRESIYETYVNIDSNLNDLGIDHYIKFSTKNIYGIYKDIVHELYKSNPSVYDVRNIIRKKNIHDLISMQIVVNDEVDCFITNRHIHEKYNVEEIYSKDYIRKPKANMYRSLHTTIYDKGAKFLQIQIRTPEMDKVADYGFAACWDLSGSNAKQTMQDGIKRNYSKAVHAIDRVYVDSAEYLTHFKQEILSENNIEVYTPTHEVINLPLGATVIDFAYRIHSDYGDKLGFAVVNNKYQDIFHVLHDGDTVKLFKAEEDLADESWLDYAVTVRAKKKIGECIKRNKDNSEYKEKRMRLV